jgi:type I restriction enzyme S subunit
MLSSNWITASLGEVVKFASGGTPSRENASYWNGNIPWFSAKDLKRFQLLDSEEHITENGSQNGTRVVEPKTILILVRGMTLLKSFPVGMTTRHSAFNQDLRAVIPNDCLDREFLAYWLTANENKVMALVDQAGHGTGRLATDRLAGLDISFPSNLFEQQAIAHVLSAWDRGIRQLSDLIAAKLRFKQGLMHQLLTGRRRFKEFGDEWQTVLLKDVAEECEERNRGRLRTDSVMAVKKAEGIVPMRERTIAADIDRYSVVKKDYFAYNPMRLNIGSIARWSGDRDVLVSPDYVVFHCKKPTDDRPAIDTGFLDQYRRSSLWERYVTSSGNGSVRVRIYFSDLGGMKLNLPSMAEQRKITAALNAADREIDFLRKELDALKTQKKGLMQKLLTGQVRVKVAPELNAQGPKL